MGVFTPYSGEIPNIHVPLIIIYVVCGMPLRCAGEELQKHKDRDEGKKVLSLHISFPERVRHPTDATGPAASENEHEGFRRYLFQTNFLGASDSRPVLANQASTGLVRLPLSVQHVQNREYMHDCANEIFVR